MESLDAPTTRLLARSAISRTSSQRKRWSNRQRPDRILTNYGNDISDAGPETMGEHQENPTSAVNRREALGAGVLAGGMLLADANKAAAQVEDRTSSIRISGVRAIPVGPK